MIQEPITEAEVKPPLIITPEQAQFMRSDCMSVAYVWLMIVSGYAQQNQPHPELN